MKFNLNKWIKFRREAEKLGLHIRSFKDKKGVIHMHKDSLEGYLMNISSILRRCSNYMDKCRLTMPERLWKYNPVDPTTHPSSVAFLYKHRMTPEAIKAYGKGFMKTPLPKDEEAA